MNINCLPSCLPACLPVCLSVCQSVSQSVSMSICLSPCLFVSLSPLLSVSMSVCLSVCLFLCLSSKYSPMLEYSKVAHVDCIYISTAACEDRQVRLAGSTYHASGRVEICDAGVWKTVCSDEYWDDTDATIICRQLGFSPYGTVKFNLQLRTKL